MMDLQMVEKIIFDYIDNNIPLLYKQDNCGFGAQDKVSDSKGEWIALIDHGICLLDN